MGKGDTVRVGAVPRFLKRQKDIFKRLIGETERPQIPTKHYQGGNARVHRV